MPLEHFRHVLRQGYQGIYILYIYTYIIYIYPTFSEAPNMTRSYTSDPARSRGALVLPSEAILSEWLSSSCVSSYPSPGVYVYSPVVYWYFFSGVLYTVYSSLTVLVRFHETNRFEVLVRARHYYPPSSRDKVPHLWGTSQKICHPPYKAPPSHPLVGVARFGPKVSD